jgi:transcriptional regulator with XRE-family HTH domain
VAGVEVVSGPEEIGRRIRAARGYTGLGRPEFARKLGVSESTLRRMEDGDEAALGRTRAKRNQAVDLVLQVSGAPASLFVEVKAGSPSTEERLREVEKWVQELRDRVLGQTLGDLEEDEEREAQQYRSSAASSEEQELGGTSG